MKIETQYVDLDSLLRGGFNMPSFNVIGARTGVGKTVFMLNLCINIALKSEHKISYITLDQDQKQLLDKFQTYFEYQEIKPEYAKVLNNVDILANYLKFEELLDYIETQNKNYGTRIFFIDYVQLLNESKESPYDYSSYIAIMLKNLSTRLGICIIATSQLSRACDTRSGHRPILTDLRDTGALEESADLVMLLLRREYYDPNDKPGEMEVIIAKNRHGTIGAIRVCFAKEICLVANYVPVNYSYQYEPGEANAT